MADLRSSAAYRIAFVYSAAFAMAIVLLGAAVYFVADAEFRRQRDLGIAEESADLTRTLRTEGWQELSEAVATRERSDQGISGLRGSRRRGWRARACRRSSSTDDSRSVHRDRNRGGSSVH